MYIALLIKKYLRRKLAPLFAALAVTLCSAMVIIVISVMGGFLQLMRDSAHRLAGDVIVRSDLAGFPHYDELIQRLTQRPEVAAATPVVSGYGLIKLQGAVEPVEVMGIEPIGFDAATGYRATLHWTQQDLLQLINNDTTRQLDPVRMAMAMTIPAGGAGGAAARPALVPGIHVPPFSRRDSRGNYDFRNSSVLHEATLTVLPITQQGGLLQPESQRFAVVNEFKSGLYEIDAKRVFIAFHELQRMMLMQAADAVNPDTGEVLGQSPARTHRVVVRAQPGVDLITLLLIVEAELERLRQTHADLPLVVAETWTQQHAMFLGAVEKEKALVTILFAIISVVAFAMIAVIFYMIVMEKTRDIGVLRALGASQRGVAGIFLGYGLTIGLIGSGLGLLIATLIVARINEIQAWLTRTIRFTMWDPSVYYFDRIPAKLDPAEVAWILTIAVACSLLGAAIPAWRASRVDPVASLRYE